MSIRHRRAIAVAAAAALFAVSMPARGAAPAAPGTTTDPAAAAAGWLAQQFVGGNHIAGSFGSPPTFFVDYGGTADSIFGLAAARVGRTKIDAGVAYLAAHADAYADLTRSQQFGPADGAVAKMALAAIVARADATQFGDDPTHPGHPLDLLQQLKKDECPAASTTCTPGAAANVGSSVAESLVILAEVRGAAAVAAKYAPSAAAIRYFLSLRCANGGFTIATDPAGCASDVDATSYAMAALVALGDEPSALDRAGAWLLTQRKPAGYWVEPPTPGPNTDSTGLAVSALEGAGMDSATSRAWLASQQVTTGPTIGSGATRGALKFQGAFNPTRSPKATADGLLGLARGASLATLTADGATPGTAVLALETPTTMSTSVAQGAKQTVTGLGFSAGEKVSAVLHSAAVSLGGVTASKAGTAVVTFTVPVSLALGTHHVGLTGATSGLISTATFTVTKAVIVPVAAPSSPTGADALANSGLDGQQALAEALVGLGLIVAGAGALHLGRRRRA